MRRLLFILAGCRRVHGACRAGRVGESPLLFKDILSSRRALPENHSFDNLYGFSPEPTGSSRRTRRHRRRSIWPGRRSRAGAERPAT